jgi:hypothetical protein
LALIASAWLLKRWRHRRTALDDARTGKQHGFADLVQLFAFLQAQTAGWTGQDEHLPESES